MMQSRREQTADVVVVGAGVLGAFHAYFAAQKGLSTFLLERNSMPNDASIRNFGMLPQTIVDPAGSWGEYARASADIYRSVHERHDISLSSIGSLYLASTKAEATVLREFAAHPPAGIRCTYLRAAQVQARYPFVCQSYCRGALLFPDDLSLDPRQMIHRLIPYLVNSAGVRYVPNTPVVSIRSSEGRCVVTGARGNTFVARTVIVCTGADYHALFPEHFRGSGLQVCKLQMMRTSPMTEIRIPHSILSGLSIRRYPAFAACASFEELAAEPMNADLQAYGVHVLIKQSSDGTVTIGDSHEYALPDDAAVFTERTNPAINDAILEYASTMIDVPHWPIRELWNGYYLTHPTDPVYAAQVDEGIHIVTGIGGKGMTTGPGFAQRSIERLFP